MRQARVPEYIPPPPPAPPKDVDEKISDVFLRIPYNYQEQNANSK
jgi:hypothetical protein